MLCVREEWWLLKAIVAVPLISSLVVMCFPSESATSKAHSLFKSHEEMMNQMDHEVCVLSFRHDSNRAVLAPEMYFRCLLPSECSFVSFYSVPFCDFLCMYV